MMKRLKLFAAALVIVGIVGCKTPIDRQQACEAAGTVYAGYLAVIMADGNPSKDQFAAAEAAHTFLKTYCNWTMPRSPKYDKCGLPILTPPSK